MSSAERHPVAECDMLVRLYRLSEERVLEAERELRGNGILLKKAMTPDLFAVTEFVRRNFSEGWAGECTAAVLKNCCWIAVKERRIIGFACYDTTIPDYFGPTGVLESERGQGIGKVLLLRALMSMKEMGYAYAVIGWAGPTEFYRRCVGAEPIADSIPHSYRNLVANVTDDPI